MLSLDQAGAGLSVSRPVPVPGPLDPWVEGVWIQAGRDGAGPGGWRIVPDPNPHLIVSVSGSTERRPPRVVLVGARSRAADARGRRRMTVGVRLRPGALPALAREEAGAFTDRAVELEDLLPSYRPLLERVREAASREDGPAVVEALLGMLRHRLYGRNPVDWRVRALDADPRASPGSVTCRTGVSARGLRAVARREVGLSPGRLLRIRRLQRALSLRLAGEEPSWASAALAAGFHDPAHLVRTAQDLLGETPGAFAGRRLWHDADPYNGPGPGHPYPG